MNISAALQTLQDTVGAWPALAAQPHRFGGVEFVHGKVEIGHIHRNGMIDIPLTVPLRRYLVAQGLAEPHHLLGDSGWVSFYVRQAEDVEGALWLFRLSYLHKLRRRQPQRDWQPEIAQLNLEPTLRELLKLDAA
ncbi:MAG: DUF5519 family protein [Anaerolineae bacterium]|nr:DUF5519 family protein [Anaerolineae bacterium]